ncbi:hypothetical protein U14_01554 [Candidatus Moduliflexus flocculans]|uniref:Uncharacterized protein n=1 Tax=Candidatus Moduliflexus flocculans TaxID=1499966 RepID=A0A0S6VYD1_9BACT|nr:hypothetical protein U14_01554 [Candidatus Moduliflexus flocculans]
MKRVQGWEILTNCCHCAEHQRQRNLVKITGLLRRKLLHCFIYF